MVIDRGEASVCVQHPGFEPDLIVTTSTPALAEVFQGFDTWAHAVASGDIRARQAALVRALPRWFLWSPFVEPILARTRRRPRRRPGAPDPRSAPAQHE